MDIAELVGRVERLRPAGRERKGGFHMKIDCKDLTGDELTDINKRYGPYDVLPEFWHGFRGYQENGRCPDEWAEDGVAARAWDLGTEAAMRLHWDRYRCMYARDDLDSRKMHRGMQAAIEEMKKNGTLPEPYRRKKATAAVANDNEISAN